MSPLAQRLLERLDDIRQQWWLFSLLSTATWAVSLSLLLLVGMMAGDSIFHFSQKILGWLFLFWIGATSVLFFLVLRRLMRQQRTLAGTARCLEVEFPELGSDLINLVQLSETTRLGNRTFAFAAVNEAAARLKEFPLHQASKRESRLRRFRYCLQTPRDFVEACLVLGLVLVFAFSGPFLFPNWSSASGRLLQPWKFVPSVGEVTIEVEPGDVETLLGEPLEIRARAIPPNEYEGDIEEAHLFLRRSGKKEEEHLSMLRPDGKEASSEAPPAGEVSQDDRTFFVRLPSIAQELKYRIEVGDSQTRWFTVRVLEKPTVREVAVRYVFPEYMHREPEELVQKVGDLSAPQYTLAELRVVPSVPITRGRLDWKGGGTTGKVVDQGNALLAEMPLLRDTSYQIHLSNGRFSDPHPRIHHVHVLPDQPPVVEWLQPRKQSKANPNETILVAARFRDDYGLGEAELEMKILESEAPATEQTVASGETDRAAATLFGEGESPSPENPMDSSFSSETDTQAEVPSGSQTAIPETSAVSIHQWPVAQEKAKQVRFDLPLSDHGVKSGQKILLRLVARDQRKVRNWGLDVGPQETVSPWRSIEVVDLERAAEEILQERDRLKEAVFQLLEKQVRVQAQSTRLRMSEAVGGRRRLAQEIRGGQIDLQKEAIKVVKMFAETSRSEDQLIHRALSEMAFSEMLTAIDQADRLAAVEKLEEFTTPLDGLVQTQTEIITKLRNLLQIARHARAEALEEIGYRSSSDLPDDSKEKMAALDDALNEALEQQKKVIEASENLAKAPVEDFSEKEEQLSKQLQAAEDAWEKFMTELNTDLSKLPEQDFANPSLLEELVEIQTEIQQKKGSLLEKTKDIAVPLEQLGEVSAEEFQELMSNTEKWLPDTPDRERWSQEESLSDAGKEAPMAELPGELEDLIGELMEEEEDLFDEMEDVSSSAADSLDKGAGWDVADGPISNMSAKGATGNRLPNSSEIGGRAGEGRQGKSSGEFVGNEAVGKGGRKTPTRLTPDPYVKGQIKDHSKDPTGGATGGGKESGAGGAGLEGPQANARGQREMNRLAGKQADLRNKAEGIDLEHFRVMGYHHTDLQRMIEVMNQVERDLKAGRYRNALRRREVVLDGLDGVKRHLEGDFVLREDRSVNLPTNVQEELVSGSDDPSPSGWGSLNQIYFRNLSAQDTDGPIELTPQNTPDEEKQP